MEKEEKLIFNKISLIVIAIFLVSIGAFFYKYGFKKEITGASVRGKVYEVYSNIPLTSKIFLLVLWLILILILIYSFMRDKEIITRKKEIADIDLKKISEKQGTDLDTLYNILKKKEKLRLSTIAKLFNVKKEVVMDWCRTLEAGNLVFIDYSVGSPIVQIVK